MDVNTAALRDALVRTRNVVCALRRLAEGPTAECLGMLTEIAAVERDLADVTNRVAVVRLSEVTQRERLAGPAPRDQRARSTRVDPPRRPAAAPAPPPPTLAGRWNAARAHRPGGPR